MSINKFKFKFDRYFELFNSHTSTLKKFEKGNFALP